MNGKESPDLGRRKKVEEIYHTALTLETETQEAYLKQACEDDTVLYEEIKSLLTADQASGDSFQETVINKSLRILAVEEAGRDRPSLAKTIMDDDDICSLMLENRYQIIGRIGGGGMGDVYKACDTKMLNRMVVVKVLKAAAAESEWLIAKFKQEIEASNKIDNPGVVSFYDVGETPDGHPYLVMQYIEGQDLRKAIPSDRGMPFDEVTEVIRQLGRTLNIAHEKGIIHRDLKPENIMYRRDENGDLQVRVIDFGIAKIKDSMIAASTSTGIVIGTPNYMSPEQLNAADGQRRAILATSDIYSLGIIAYEMVTGRRPFNAETIIQLSALQKEGVQVTPCALRPALPEAAQRAILKALAYHPAERYQRVRDFCADLTRALLADVEPAPSPVPVQPESREIETVERPRPAKKSILLLTATAMAAVLLAAVTAGVWWKFFRFGPERVFTYSLKVQKMRDGQPFEQPFITAGQEIYEKGYKMQVLMTTEAAGYAYLFNEGKDENNQYAFFLQFPTQKQKNGVAQVSTGQRFESGWNTFKWEPGTESIWFIWTAQPEAAVETARAEALTSDQGKVPESAAAALREFISRAAASRAAASKDVAGQRTVLKGHGDIVLHLMQLEYR